MDAQTWLTKTHREYFMHPTTHDQRLGQWYFNKLAEFKPRLADAIRASDDDPFYNTGHIPDFIARITKEWNMYDDHVIILVLNDDGDTIAQFKVQVGTHEAPLGDDSKAEVITNVENAIRAILP